MVTAAILGMLLVSGTAGCGYRVARGLPFEYRRVFVAPVDNPTGEPGLEERLRTALLETMAVDGRFTISAAGDAEVILRSRIDQYQLVSTSEAGGFATQYDVRMAITFVFADGSGGVLAEYPAVRPPVAPSYRAGSDVMATETGRFRATEDGIRAVAREFLGRIYGP